MSTNLGHVPFIWDQANDRRNLQEMLSTDYGLDLTGWRLGGASGISADGKTIIGNGINPNGNSEAWVACIPEPTTFFLLALDGRCFGDEWPDNLYASAVWSTPCSGRSSEYYQVYYESEQKTIRHAPAIANRVLYRRLHHPLHHIPCAVLVLQRLERHYKIRV